MKRFLLFILNMMIVCNLWSQAGSDAFQFLNLSYSAKVTSLGGNNVSLRNGDMSLALYNPASLSDESNKMISLNYANLTGKINFASVGYCHKLSSNDYLAAYMQFCDYGKFDKYTAQDYYEGSFSAKDMALNIIYTRKLNDYWNVGLNFKPIYSNYETYQSLALAGDIGINYFNANIGLSFGLSARNIGAQVVSFYKDGDDKRYQSLPINLCAGLSYRIPKAPLRFSVTYNNIERWDLTPNKEKKKTSSLIDENKKNDKITGLGMFFRHTVFAVEIVPKSEKFYFGLSYNVRRQQEMSTAIKRSMSGLAFGAGCRIYKFDLGVGVAQYTISGWTVNVSLSTSLARFNL